MCLACRVVQPSICSIGRPPSRDRIMSAPSMSKARRCRRIGYARVTGRMGVAITTSGPGATNLLTGTCCFVLRFGADPDAYRPGGDHRAEGQPGDPPDGVPGNRRPVDLQLRDQARRAGPAIPADSPAPRRGVVLGLRRQARLGPDRPARRPAARRDRSRRAWCRCAAPPVAQPRATGGRPRRAESKLAETAKRPGARCSAAASARLVWAPNSMP